MDDILLTASSTTYLQRIIASLHQDFFITDLGPLNYFLGISVARTGKGMFLCQKKGCNGGIFERVGMRNCHFPRTLLIRSRS